ncbi:NAD(P)-dependent alcohol dehydrogenase [Saccharibacillus deserti]|uniref:NAD(P)-dependent alcohol dehydrogenase n=1 Tax=Saccharibacillus deserti TaxID=1634444 RepID=UPI00155292E1|nr:NAD(P)-dependent alcohol dehydrogenase [Saccharibacillus deserti]
MRAMVQHAYGSPEVIVLEELDVPEPGNQEILIHVQAATVGPANCAFRQGDPWIIKLMYGWSRPKFAVGGTELAGVVAAVGLEVEHFKAGDRVVGTSPRNFGAYAEYKGLAEKSSVALIPGSVSFEEAVGVCDGGATALIFLRDKARLQKGQRVLINGASGAVGIYAVQLAKYYGAQVTGVCSAGSGDLVRQAGADLVIDYHREDFTKTDRVYDVIFDAVGKSSFSACRRVLTKRGLYLTTALKPSTLLHMLRTALFPGRKVIFATAGLMQNKANLEFLMQLTQEGVLNAVIDRRYPLEQLADAQTYVETGRKKGNVILYFAASKIGSPTKKAARPL